MLILATPQCNCHLAFSIENEEVALLGFKHANFEWVFDLDVLATLDLKLPDSIKVMVILLLIVRSEFLFLAPKALIFRFLNNI